MSCPRCLSGILEFRRLVVGKAAGSWEAEVEGGSWKKAVLYGRAGVLERD